MELSSCYRSTEELERGARFRVKKNEVWKEREKGGKEKSLGKEREIQIQLERNL